MGATGYGWDYLGTKETESKGRGKVRRGEGEVGMTRHWIKCMGAQCPLTRRGPVGLEGLAMSKVTSDNLSSIPGIHMVEGKSQFPKVVLCLAHIQMSK